MFNVCARCGGYAADKRISEDGTSMTCPLCGFESEIVRPPLFMLTGSSGAGKSAIGARLMRRRTEYIVMEGDILWCDAFNSPADDYRAFREIWLRLCKNISQNGTPVLLCGSCVPAQYESCVERRYFSDIHYVAAVCRDDVLAARLKARPGWRDSSGDAQIKGFLDFNRWFYENAVSSDPPIHLLDTTDITVDVAADAVDAWIREIMKSK